MLPVFTAPWYAKPSGQTQDKYMDQHVKRNHKNDDNPHRRKRKPLKINDDPLDYITKTLSKRDDKKRSSKREHKSSSPSSDKKNKKHSHKHSRSEKSTTSIEDLRAKRLERERHEQSRLKSLYLHDGEDVQEEKVEMDDRKRGYNSQFNREETSKAHDHRRKKPRYQQE